jgi:hypothetical protein
LKVEPSSPCLSKAGGPKIILCLKPTWSVCLRVIIYSSLPRSSGSWLLPQYNNNPPFSLKRLVDTLQNYLVFILQIFAKSIYLFISCLLFSWPIIPPAIVFIIGFCLYINWVAWWSQ